jgi:hypothetical protein
MSEADAQPTNLEGQVRKNRRANVIWAIVFLVGVGAVVSALLASGGGAAATEKAAASRLIKQAFQNEETEKKEEHDRKVLENASRMQQASGGKNREEYFIAFQKVNVHGINSVSPEEVATLKRFAPDYVQSRYAVVHMQEKGYDSLTADERAAVLQFADVNDNLRQEARQSALRDPLWKEMQELLELPADAALPFGLLTADDRKQAVQYARQGKEQGFSSLTVDDVRLLIRAGADEYLKKLAGM